MIRLKTPFKRITIPIKRVYQNKYVYCGGAFWRAKGIVSFRDLKCHDFGKDRGVRKTLRHQKDMEVTESQGCVRRHGGKNQLNWRGFWRANAIVLI